MRINRNACTGSGFLIRLMSEIATTFQLIDISIIDRVIEREQPQGEVVYLITIYSNTF